MVPGVEASEITISIEGQTPVSGLVVRPPTAVAVLVLAHGAGADMRHAFMEGLAQALAELEVATLRFQFPYSQAGGKVPDKAPICEATVRAACEAAPADLPRFAGGKSMGARMATRAQAQAALPDVRGLVAFGFPLHPAGKPEKRGDRADHFARVQVPQLILQGERDALGTPVELAPHLAPLGRAVRLHIVPGADHAFATRGKKPPQVLTELARVTRDFVDEVLA
jgi:predicted alpha/beta-hydrolase family hydrolase